MTAGRLKTPENALHLSWQHSILDAEREVAGSASRRSDEVDTNADVAVVSVETSKRAHRRRDELNQSSDVGELVHA